MVREGGARKLAKLLVRWHRPAMAGSTPSIRGKKVDLKTRCPVIMQSNAKTARLRL